MQWDLQLFSFDFVFLCFALAFAFKVWTYKLENNLFSRKTFHFSLLVLLLEFLGSSSFLACDWNFHLLIGVFQYWALRLRISCYWPLATVFILHFITKLQMRFWVNFCQNWSLNFSYLSLKVKIKWASEYFSEIVKKIPDEKKKKIKLTTKPKDL